MAYRLTPEAPLGITVDAVADAVVAVDMFAEKYVAVVVVVGVATPCYFEGYVHVEVFVQRGFVAIVEVVVVVAQSNDAG